MGYDWVVFVQWVKWLAGKKPRRGFPARGAGSSLIQELPAISEGDSSRLAGSDAGCRFLPIVRFAGSTAVPYFFALLRSDLGYRLFPEGVIFIIADLKDIRWTDICALAAAVAFITIKFQKPVA